MTDRPDSTSFSAPLDASLDRAALDLDRPRLLVSVRSSEEVEMAIGSGADIVDLKEPRAGALSPTDPQLWRQVARRWEQVDANAQLPRFSAALGERAEARDCAASLPARFDFAKAGPSGCSDETQLRRLWSDVRQQLDPSIELVAVAYADWESAGCPTPQSVFQLAHQSGIRRCLLDTFDKAGKSSLQLMGLGSLRELAGIARSLDLWWALAGSVRCQDVAPLRAVALAPDCFGVRGDVCRGAKREETLQADRIEDWLRELGHRPQVAGLRSQV